MGDSSFFYSRFFTFTIPSASFSPAHTKRNRHLPSKNEQPQHTQTHTQRRDQADKQIPRNRIPLRLPLGPPQDVIPLHRRARLRRLGAFDHLLRDEDQHPIPRDNRAGQLVLHPPGPLRRCGPARPGVPRPPQAQHLQQADRVRRSAPHQGGQGDIPRRREDDHQERHEE